MISMVEKSFLLRCIELYNIYLLLVKMMKLSLSSYHTKYATASWKLIQKRFNTTNVSSALQITNSSLKFPISKQQCKI